MPRRKIVLIIVIVIFIILVGFITFNSMRSNINTLTDDLLSQPVTKSEDTISQPFISDLKSAFSKAMTNLNLPKESVVMVDVYSGNESQPVNIKFENDENTNKQFYMASTIKPLYLSMIIQLLKINNPETRIPFKFVDEEKQLKEVASETSQNLTYNYSIDELLLDKLVPIFKAKNVKTSDDVYSELLTNPDLTNLTLSVRELFTYTLGPSSNWGLEIFKNYFAIQNSVDVEHGVNIVEDHLNDMLKAQGITANLVLNQSSTSKSKQTLNSDYFYEAEYLFEDFYENKFNLNTSIFNLMKDSMKEVSQDQIAANRRHEIKSMAKNVGIVNAEIIEKSGYIGFDYEAAPGLVLANGQDKMPQMDGERIVFFDACIFSRIYLTNGNFVQFNYSISAPFYISNDPSYEELNPDYTANKNKINDLLQQNIQPVLEKYKNSIKLVSQ